MCAPKALLSGGLRTANFVIAGVGGAMMGYGGYLAVKFPDADPFWTGVISLGAIHFLFAATVLFCGWRSLFALRLYGTVIGLLAIAEAAITLLYWIPSTRDNIINAVPADVKTELQGQLTFAGIALAAVVGFQVCVLLLTWAQCSAVDPLNAALLDDDVSLASGAAAPGGSRASERTRLKGGGGGGSRAAAAEDLEGAADVAATRYKSGKAAAYYDKYGRGER